MHKPILPRNPQKLLVAPLLSLSIGVVVSLRGRFGACLTGRGYVLWLYIMRWFVFYAFVWLLDAVGMLGLSRLHLPAYGVLCIGRPDYRHR